MANLKYSQYFKAFSPSLTPFSFFLGCYLILEMRGSWEGGEVPAKWQLSWLIFMVMRLNELQEKIIILLAAG